MFSYRVSVCVYVNVGVFELVQEEKFFFLGTEEKFVISNAIVPGQSVQ